MKDFFNIKDINFKNKKVLLRVDYNVPISQSGKILDDNKIKLSLKTIKKILNQNPEQIIIMSHLGSPNGTYQKNLSLKPIAKRLQKLLELNVFFVKDYYPKTNEFTKKINNKKIILLENLRFYKEEKENNKTFAKFLASLGDIYVNDAFGASHRKHSSIDSITLYIKSCSGTLLESELNFVNKIIKNPKRPLILIFGAAKIKSKIKIIKKIINKLDKLLIGGASMFTFLKAQGYSIGKSIIDEESIKTAQNLMKKYKNKIVLPVDVVVTNSIKKEGKKIKTVDISKITKNMIGVDIGEKSIQLFKKNLKNAATILWNGPLGLFEIKPFDKATKEIAKFISKSSATSIICGGDTASAISNLKCKNRFNHISSGGGAFLEALTGKDLIGIKALKRSYSYKSHSSSSSSESKSRSGA